MKKTLKIVGTVLGLLVLAGAGFYLWASTTTDRVLSREIAVHSVDFPVPYPLDAAEVEDLGLSPEEAERLALERALERGSHLVEARYGCSECHGANYGGGVMVDDPMIGRLLGPNITTGAGSRTAGYTPADWDRIVRHGILPDGRPSAMPSVDFRRMSDRELSDIVAYLRSRPPVDNEVAPVDLGPLGTVLIATGQIPLSADVIGTHDAEHATDPPVAEVSVEFGEHLAGVCTGCHGEDLAGGPIPGGDPSWVPARNLTPDATGLGEWSYEDFVVAMREGRRPDGAEIREPMTMIQPAAQRMTDVEMEALWTYLRTLPPVERAVD